MPQILVSPPRVPPEQLPSNFQSVPDAVVSNADVNMCPNPSMELDARAQQQELDACAQQLVAGGATGDFVGEITRCFAKKEAARLEREQLLLANLNRRRMAQSAIPDTVVSNADVNMCPTPVVPYSNALVLPDTVVSNADVDMFPEGGVFIPQRLVRGPQNKGRIRKNCLTPTRWIERTRKKMSLPQYCYGPVINPTYVYPPVTGGPMPDTVVSNADVNMGLPYEDIDLPPVDDDELIMDGVLI